MVVLPAFVGAWAWSGKVNALSCGQRACAVDATCCVWALLGNGIAVTVVARSLCAQVRSRVALLHVCHVCRCTHVECTQVVVCFVSVYASYRVAACVHGAWIAIVTVGADHFAPCCLVTDGVEALVVT